MPNRFQQLKAEIAKTKKEQLDEETRQREEEEKQEELNNKIQNDIEEKYNKLVSKLLKEFHEEFCPELTIEGWGIGQWKSNSTHYFHGDSDEWIEGSPTFEPEYSVEIEFNQKNEPLGFIVEGPYQYSEKTNLDEESLLKSLLEMAHEIFGGE